jgi:CubicO group peptidase (beta-lactamase class C family)
MKKIVKGLLIVLIFLTLVFLIYVLATFPPIMRGMAAKTMCSCVYLAGRSPESVIQKELQVFPGLDAISLVLNNQDSTVTATLLWQSSKAIYRKGLGCTLLAEAEESQVRAQRYKVHDGLLVDQDTIPWPSGDLGAYSAAEDINREAIDEIVDEAFYEKDPENPINTHAVVVVYENKIIAEKYAVGFGRNSILMGWSISKSLTNALIGILVGQGKLSLDEPAPVDAWRSDERKSITLNHLLQATSGLAWWESYFVPGADFHNMFIHSDDKAAYAMGRKLKHTPGEHLLYSSGTTNILSKIIRQTVGEEKYHRFPYECLFSRIGMHHAIIEPDASGTFVASSYAFASARDWARLGLLYLNDGVWNGQRILPEGWVKYSTTPASAAKRGEYGAQIWLNAGEKGNPANVQYPGLANEAIVFDGFEDNSVVIIPSKKLVVVRMGVTHNGNFSMVDLVTGIAHLLPDRNTLAGTMNILNNQ